MHLFLPPLPFPASVKNQTATVRAVVDTLGHAFRDSVTVCGLSDVGYSQRLTTGVADMDFVPGTLGGHAIVAPTVIVYRF